MSSLVIGAALCIGCGDDVSVPRRETSGDLGNASFDLMQAPAAPADLGKSVADVSMPVMTQPDAFGDAAAIPVPSMIIRNGSATLEVDSLEIAMAAVQQIATRYGGYVGNSSLSAPEYRWRSATIELKIPAARFDSALSGLEAIGTVESTESAAQDVGEEFVDVTARVANARRLEDRLVSLLATQAGKLEEVLAVERELARIREEIERYTGRLRYLQSRVSISTLVVTVHEPAPLVRSSPGDNVLLNAFRDAWRNFVRFIAGFIASLGVVLPVLVLLAIAIWGWRRMRRPAAR